MLTIQILTKNNESTIERTLGSVADLGARIVVGDLGSDDATSEICAEMGAEVRRIRFQGDYSEARNQLISEGMNFMIEPWERLVMGHDEIVNCSSNAYVTVVKGGFANKELRLWSRGRFVNPVYETIEDDDATLLGEVAIVCHGWPDRRIEALEICSAWRDRRPTSPEPWYYSAFSSLALGRADEFLAFSERFMAMTPKFGPSETQMAYRMAQIMFGKGEMPKASGLVAKCLLHHPTFSEFWCLLGDMFYSQKMYEKARAMYENAMIMGERRSSSDSHPIEIEKYAKHPMKMIELLDKIKNEASIIVPKQV